MPELGDKHTCADCETKYYDLGRPDATCPKCGSANRIVDEETAAPPSRPVRARAQPKPKKPKPSADDTSQEDSDEDEDDVDKANDPPSDAEEE